MLVTMGFNKLDLLPTACVILILCTLINGSSAGPHNQGDLTIEESRSIVSLRNSTGHHSCAGTLITFKHVLTAAHCVFGDKGKDITVCVDSNSTKCPEKLLEVEKIHIYENYSAHGGLFHSYPVHDLGIVTLKEHVKNFPEGGFISFPDTSSPLGEIGYVAGLIRTERDGVETDHFQKIETTISDCPSQPNTEEIVDDQMCGVISPRDTMYDSGGPLIVNNEIVGVASWSRRKPNQEVDAFVRVSSYLQWISNTMLLDKEYSDHVDKLIYQVFYGKPNSSDHQDPEIKVA